MHELLFLSLFLSDKIGIYNICFRRLTARPYLQILRVKLGKLSRRIPGGRQKFVDPATANLQNLSAPFPNECDYNRLTYANGN